jgi:hypothetical protein
MPSYSKRLLSGSTNGRSIKVVATASAGTIIHATGTSSSIIDEVWLYATNTSASDVLLTVEFGGTTNPDDRIQVTVAPRNGLYLVVPGIPVTGTGSGALTIRAYAATTNVINISGYVNRIS